jgi:hypothetical protein
MVLLSILLVGCKPATDEPAVPLDTAAETPSSALPTVFTIVLENQDYVDVVGSENAPYINSLIADYGLATNYRETGDPSLPNYLHMISGDNQYPGGKDLMPTDDTYFPSAAENLGTQLEAADIPWRSYQESMSTPCTLVNSGSYVPRHDPFLYFDDQQNGPDGLCAATNVTYGAFKADLAKGTYRYMWITPNIRDDGHNPTNDPVTGLLTADAWLSVEIPKILESEQFLDGGVLFLTWDEAEGRGLNDDEQIPMIVISPRIASPGFQSDKAYTHANYLATVEDLLGLPRLDTVKHKANLLEFLAPE